MAAEKATYSIRRMARLLDVTKSGFDAWMKRRSAGPSKRARVQRHLDAHVRRVHTDSDDVYGAPRVKAALERDNVCVDEKTVAASMRRQGFVGISPRRFRPVTTLPGGKTYRIPDLVKRVWQKRAEAMREVARWIEIVYYRRRLHSALAMVPPVEFEEKLLAGREAGQVDKEASTQAA